MFYPNEGLDFLALGEVSDTSSYGSPSSLAKIGSVDSLVGSMVGMLAGMVSLLVGMEVLALSMSRSTTSPVWTSSWVDAVMARGMVSKASVAVILASKDWVASVDPT